MKKPKFSISFGGATLVFFLFVVLICFFPYWFTKDGLTDFSKTGQIGDTIGGIMGPFVAIAASFLTFLAFWTQYKANNQQRDDIALERFETNLFQMLQMQEEITNSLYFTPSDGADRLYNQHFRGREIFKILYDVKGFDGNWGISTSISKNGIEAYCKDVDTFILDHYFRHLYRIIKYIDEAEILQGDLKRQYKYTCIVRSSFSQYELLMLFYNCLCTNGIDKFKPLIEKYALLNNIRCELLVTDKELYKSKLDPSYNFSKDENRDMSKEYKKGAFVFNNRK